MNTTVDWSNAEAHLREVKEGYESLVNITGVIPYFALGVIAAAAFRFEGGERTQDLYDEIMSLE